MIRLPGKRSPVAYAGLGSTTVVRNPSSRANRATGTASWPAPKIISSKGGRLTSKNTCTCSPPGRERREVSDRGYRASIFSRARSITDRSREGSPRSPTGSPSSGMKRRAPTGRTGEEESQRRPCTPARHSLTHRRHAASSTRSFSPPRSIPSCPQRLPRLAEGRRNVRVRNRLDPDVDGSRTSQSQPPDQLLVQLVALEDGAPVGHHLFRRLRHIRLQAPAGNHADGVSILIDQQFGTLAAISGPLHADDGGQRHLPACPLRRLHRPGNLPILLHVRHLRQEMRLASFRKERGSQASEKMSM